MCGAGPIVVQVASKVGAVTGDTLTVPGLMANSASFQGTSC